MQLLLKKLIILPFILIITGLISSLYAQQKSVKKQTRPFIESGTILTTFSFSFINGSRAEYNQDFAREVTGIAFQMEGLYFISKRVAVGPLFSYGFTYRDFFNVLYPPRDIDVRRSYWIAGVKGAYYIPLNEIFGGDGDTYLFLDGSLFRQHFSFVEENDPDHEKNEFGYQVGTGILIPVGKQIAINMKLGFRSFRRKYKFYNKEENLITNIRWPKELFLSVGLSVTF